MNYALALLHMHKHAGMYNLIPPQGSNLSPWGYRTLRRYLSESNLSCFNSGRKGFKKPISEEQKRYILENYEKYNIGINKMFYFCKRNGFTISHEQISMIYGQITLNSTTMNFRIQDQKKMKMESHQLQKIFISNQNTKLANRNQQSLKSIPKE